MPSIDWTTVPQEYNWLAIDSNGAAYLYTHRPESDSYTGVWRVTEGDYTSAEGHASLVKDADHWKESLVSRDVPEEKTTILADLRKLLAELRKPETERDIASIVRISVKYENIDAMSPEELRLYVMQLKEENLRLQQRR